MVTLPPISIRPEALDQLMPMHVIARADGRITHVGPTIAKIHPGQALLGRPFTEVFEIRRPRHASDLEEICGLSGGKVHLRLRDPDRTQVAATGIRLGTGQGVLVNLSFGISVVDAVARFNLAGSDFAATDLAVEMLYLVEAKSAAMAESRKLNERLNGAKSAAEAEALSDTLTGLANRRALDQQLDRLIARGTPFALMQLDLDFFKAVNDTLGHAAGDHVLRRVARIMQDEIRDDDVVARIGGDEFVLVIKGMTESWRLNSIADRLLRRLARPIPYRGETTRISGSIGMVCSTYYDRPEADRMLHDADIALYASKARGRACCTMFTQDMRAAQSGA